MAKKFKYKYFKNKNNQKKKKIPLIIVNLHIKSTFKNTIISLTKLNGNLLKQWSTKSLKKTRFKKNTPYNVQLIVYQINKYMKLKKMNKLKIHFNGTGVGRYNILKNLNKKYIEIIDIFDKTKKPFNGCRLKKPKRL